MPTSRYQTGGYNRKTRYKRRRHIRPLRFAIFLGVVALLGFIVFALSMTFGDTIVKGVTIDGLDVSGMTKAEAVTLLQERNRIRMDGMYISVKYQERVWSFTSSDIDAKSDHVQQVELAMRIGRSGNPFKRMQDRTEARRETVALKTTISYDLERLRPVFENIRQELETPPIEATLQFDPDAADGKYFTITPERDGIILDVDALLTTISTQFKANWRVEGIEIALTPVEPNIKAADLESGHKLITVATTSIGDSSNDRITNIEVSAASYHGLIIEPGQEVSFNEVVGERTEARGFRKASVIQDGLTVPGMGGGICQTSSTLYNAVLKADLEIVTRIAHTIPSTYVRRGLDATVDYPVKDFVFRNSYSTPIYIRAYVERSAQRLRIEIYGTPLEGGVEIELTSEIIKTEPPPEGERIIKDTEQLHVTYEYESKVFDAKEGITVTSYKVYKKDGQEVDRQQIATTTYPPRQAIRYVGVEPLPPGMTPPPSETPMPSTTVVTLPTPTPTPSPSPDPSPTPAE